MDGYWIFLFQVFMKLRGGAAPHELKAQPHILLETLRTHSSKAASVHPQLQAALQPTCSSPAVSESDGSDSNHKTHRTKPNKDDRRDHA